MWPKSKGHCITKDSGTVIKSEPWGDADTIHSCRSWIDLDIDSETRSDWRMLRSGMA